MDDPNNPGATPTPGDQAEEFQAAEFQQVNESAGQTQRFLTVQSTVQNLFRFGRRLIRVAHNRLFREPALVEWRQMACAV